MLEFVFTSSSKQLATMHAASAVWSSVNMNQVDLDESDEAFINRANLLFYSDYYTSENCTRKFAQCPVLIEAWEDVFSALLSKGQKPKGPLPRLLMYVFMMDMDASGRFHIDRDDLMARTSVKTKKTMQKALLAVETNGWICRGDGDEAWLEPRLVERAKRIFELMQRTAINKENPGRRPHQFVETS
jgi:hypothetical protein